MFVRTRVLTPDPTAGRRDSTCRGVNADADAVFFLGLADASNKRPLPLTSKIGVLNKSPTASSRSGRSLAYADASQSPFLVRRFHLSFCGTCGSWILPVCSTHHLEVFVFSDLPSFRCMSLKVLSGLMTSPPSDDVLHRSLLWPMNSLGFHPEEAFFSGFDFTRTTLNHEHLTKGTGMFVSA